MKTKIRIENLELEIEDYRETIIDEKEGKYSIGFCGHFPIEQKDEILKVFGQKPFEFTNPDGKEMQMYPQNYSYSEDDSGTILSFDAEIESYDPKKHADPLVNISLEAVYLRARFRALIELLIEKNIINYDELLEKFNKIMENDSENLIKEVIFQEYPEKEKVDKK